MEKQLAIPVLATILYSCISITVGNIPTNFFLETSRINEAIAARLAGPIDNFVLFSAILSSFYLAYRIYVDSKQASTSIEKTKLHLKLSENCFSFPVVPNNLLNEFGKARQEGVLKARMKIIQKNLEG